MRIWQVLLSSGFAGVERYVSTTSAALADRGHEVTVIGNPLAAAAGMRLATAESVIQAIRASRQLAKPDLIHCHMTRAEAAGLLLALQHQVPLVSTRHFAQQRGSNPVSKAFSYAYNRQASAQFAIGEFVAERVEWPKCTVVPLGTTSSRGHGNIESRTVLILQRLSAEKGTELGLRAWMRSDLAASGWTLRIVGSGQDEAQLRRLADRLSIAGSVEFAGHSENPEVEFQRSAVLLATASAEPFGLTVLEAMAHGVPVVAADAGGHRETLGPLLRESGFPPGDEAAAAARLTQLAQDLALRSRLGAAGQARQREYFTIERHVDQLVFEYERILNAESH